MKREFVVSIALSLNIFLGCTANKNSSETPLQNALPIAEIPNPNTDISNSDNPPKLLPVLPEIPTAISPKEVEKIISEVQKNLNKETQYSLSNDDLAILSDAGLDQADLKGWVK